MTRFLQLAFCKGINRTNQLPRRHRFWKYLTKLISRPHSTCYSRTGLLAWRKAKGYILAKTASRHPPPFAPNEVVEILRQPPPPLLPVLPLPRYFVISKASITPTIAFPLLFCPFPCDLNYWSAFFLLCFECGPD